MHKDLAASNDRVTAHSVEPELELRLALVDELVLEVARDRLVGQRRNANVRILLSEPLEQPVEVVVAALDACVKCLFGRINRDRKRE